MKKASNKPAQSDMRAEYDFPGGIRGKYARRYAQGTNVVVLEPDVARLFPNAAAVNRSLRALLRMEPDKPLKGSRLAGSLNLHKKRKQTQQRPSVTVRQSKPSASPQFSKA